LVILCAYVEATVNKNLYGSGHYSGVSSSSSSSSFNFKAHETSKSIQIKTGTARQDTALMVALKININTSIKHQTVNKAYNIGKTQTTKIR